MSTFNVPVTVNIPSQLVTAQLSVPVQVTLPAQQITTTVAMDVAALAAALAPYITSAMPQ